MTAKTTSHVPTGNNQQCPNCGYCPTCGRAKTYPQFVPYPWYPNTYPWYQPTWISWSTAASAATPMVVGGSYSVKLTG